MTKSKRTNQLQFSVFDQLENNKKWPMLGHAFYRLSASWKQHSWTWEPAANPWSQMRWWGDILLLWLSCTALPPFQGQFISLQFKQIQTGEKSNCEVSQKSCQSAGNQFSPCSMSGTLRRHSMFQSSLAEDCYWELQPSTVLSRYRKLNTFEDSLEKVIPLFTVPFLSFQPAIA